MLKNLKKKIWGGKLESFNLYFKEVFKIDLFKFFINNWFIFRICLVVCWIIWNIKICVWLF